MLLTKKEAAEKMRVSLSTINELIRNKAIPFVRIGQRTLRFQLSDIEQYLRKNTSGVSKIRFPYAKKEGE